MLFLKLFKISKNLNHPCIKPYYLNNKFNNLNREQEGYPQVYSKSKPIKI